MWRIYGFDVDGQGHLTVGGCDVVDLAREFGTPLYVYDDAAVRGIGTDFINAVREYLPGGKASFASKAFPNMAIERLLCGVGFGVDAASLGELETALRAGVPACEITVHGNNRTDAELERAISAEVGCICIDDASEVPRVAIEARRQKKQARVTLRITPGVQAGAHKFIQTAALDSKFGIPLIGDAALNALLEAASHPELELLGVNCHIGSQLMGFDGYDEAALRLVGLMAQFTNRTGTVLPVLDMGGGFSAWYSGEEGTPAPAEGVRRIAEAVRTACEKHSYPMPSVWLEPGRLLVAQSCVALYTVGAVKSVPGIRDYVVINGGIHDNLRPALYQAKYTGKLVNRMNDSDEGVYRIVGSNCESSDVFISEASLPLPRRGDLVGIFSSGAYQLAMASNYNRFAKPAAVLVRDGRAELIIARQTIDDVLAQDRMPSWL